MIARARNSDASFESLVSYEARPAYLRLARSSKQQRPQPQTCAPKWAARLLSAWLVLTAAAALAIVLFA